MNYIIKTGTYYEYIIQTPTSIILFDVSHKTKKIHIVSREKDYWETIKKRMQKNFDIEE